MLTGPDVAVLVLGALCLAIGVREVRAYWRTRRSRRLLARRLQQQDLERPLNTRVQTWR